MDPTNGIVIGEVTDLEDPENLGRVRVKFPHLDNQASDWARIAAPMAGPDRGVFFRPEVGDEVLVAFLQRDPRWSIVVGALWSKVDRPPEDDGNPTENNWRFMKSRSGHVIKLDDTKGAELMEFVEGAGEAWITIKSAGDICIECNSGDIKIKAGSANVSIEASQSVQVSAQSVAVKSSGDMSFEAGGALTFKGANVELAGNASVKVNAPSVQIN